MNKEEYIVISKTAIQKRIEELEKEYILLSNKSDRSLSDIEKEREIVGEQRGLATIISQSTPLIPVVKKAYRAGYCYSQYHEYNEKGEIQIESEEDYISNLKLDI